MNAPAATSSRDELVDLVDEHDRVIGQASRAQVRRDNLLHRCVAILCANPSGDVYVHRRTDTKDVFPGMYDAFVGGVVGARESYDAAAVREIAEELGIVGPTPQHLFDYHYEGPDSRSFTAVYRVTWDGPITHQASEVAWGAYLSPADVWAKMSAAGGWRFVPDGLEIYRAMVARHTSAPPDGDSTLPPRVGAALRGDGCATFDADGTLWHGDISEDFTRWMIAQGRFEGTLWESYELLDRIDPAAACFHIARFYRGMDPEEVRRLVATFHRDGPGRRSIGATVGAMRAARAAGMKTFVVSGTPTIVLQPLADALPVDGIFGLELETDLDGRFTGRACGIPTVGASKADRIRSETQAEVQLAAGNSMLDVGMLKLARGAAWVINPDAELRTLAARCDWVVSDVAPHS